jgi:hypothetical protein
LEKRFNRPGKKFLEIFSTDFEPFRGGRVLTGTTLINQSTVRVQIALSGPAACMQQTQGTFFRLENR